MGNPQHKPIRLQDRDATFKKVDTARIAVLSYLRLHYKDGDLAWHPLFTAVRELWMEAYHGRIS